MTHPQSLPTIDSIIEQINHKINSSSPEEGIRFLLELDRRIYPLIGHEAIRFGNGIHTKHRHIQYHNFFIRHIKPGEKVVDLGCGNGTCAYDIATHVPGCRMTGIDMNIESITFAQKNYVCDNLTFQHGDITSNRFREPCDVIVLSNVLEHIEERVSFLRNADRYVHPKRWLIRVPIYERDWLVPLKDELGIDCRLDPTHCIEFKKGELEGELLQAGLQISEVEYGWGEMWCVIKRIRDE